jgi:hypothetical protein
VRHCTSFELWDRWVRQCVIWVGTKLAPSEFDDPVKGVDEAHAQEPDLQALGRLLVAWQAVFGTTAVTCAEVLRVYEGVEAYNAAQRARSTVAEVPAPEETELTKALQEFRPPPRKPDGQ